MAASKKAKKAATLCGGAPKQRHLADHNRLLACSIGHHADAGTDIRDFFRLMCASSGCKAVPRNDGLTVKLVTMFLSSSPYKSFAICDLFCNNLELEGHSKVHAYNSIKLLHP
jgi:hypothetical protein